MNTHKRSLLRKALLAIKSSEVFGHVQHKVDVDYSITAQDVMGDVMIFEGSANITPLRGTPEHVKFVMSISGNVHKVTPTTVTGSTSLQLLRDTLTEDLGKIKNSSNRSLFASQ